MTAMFAAGLRAAMPPNAGAEIDVTAAYQEARRQVFATLRAHGAALRPGEAVLVHRHLLHGVAPWGEDGDRHGPRAG